MGLIARCPVYVISAVDIAAKRPHMHATILCAVEIVKILLGTFSEVRSIQFVDHMARVMCVG